MALVSFYVLEGPERGTLFADLPTPLTIGREEDNAIRLNDERISRFHAKLQDDAGQVILTDLESTNGTRVNGRPVQLRVLRPGDQILLGRSLLLFGKPSEILERGWQDAGFAGDEQTIRRQPGGSDASPEPASDLPPGFENTPLFAEGAPPLPRGLRALHAAQLADLLAHLHDEITQILVASEEAGNDAGEGEREAMLVPWPR